MKENNKFHYKLYTTKKIYKILNLAKKEKKIQKKFIQKKKFIKIK